MLPLLVQDMLVIICGGDDAARGGVWCFVQRAIVSRMRATRELVVKNIQHHAGR